MTECRVQEQVSAPFRHILLSCANDEGKIVLTDESYIL
jgi:hypothetical protein